MARGTRLAANRNVLPLSLQGWAALQVAPLKGEYTDGVFGGE